jgi:hypothetical protein
MMGLSLPPSATINDALSLVSAMLDPQTAKATLEQIKAEIDRLDRARVEADAAQKRAEKMITEADAVAAACSSVSSCCC